MSAASSLIGGETTGCQWPQWRGPLGTGVAPAGQPPIHWSETSNVLWKATIPGKGASTPIIWDHHVFILSAQLAAEVATTNSTQTAQAGATQDPGGFGIQKPTVPHRFLVLDFFSGNNAKLSCLDAATGQPRFEAQSLEGLSGMYASPAAAAGHIYIVGRDGQGVVLRRGPQVEVLARNTLEDRFDASPAIAGDALFLRGQRSLYCLAHRR